MKLSIFIVLIVLVVSGCGEEPESPQQKQARRQVVNLFKSNEEPMAKDATWTSDKILKIGLIDDGSKRDGYAKYACQVLYDHGLEGLGKVVQIIDINKLVQTKKWVKLGMAYCK